MSAKLTKEEAELTEVARNYMERCEQLETELAALRARAEAAEGLREALKLARVKIESRAINLEENDEFVLSEEYFDLVKQIDAALTAYDKSKGG
jgi:hypothetical protein